MPQEAQSWYSQEIVKQMEAGKWFHKIKVDVRFSPVKPLHAKWIVKFYDYVRGKHRFIKNDWRESGITLNRHNEKINLGPFA